MYVTSKIDELKFIEYLKEKWGGRPCPMCNVGGWIVQDTAYQLMQYNNAGGLLVGGPVIPVVPVTCRNCGNTVLINALVAGVVPLNPPSGIPTPGPQQ